MLTRMPKKISLANTPTPLRRLDRLSDSFPGTSLWIKSDDLSGFGLSGNKVRKLEFLLADALEKKYDYIITCGGIQSNHCRATALACAQLGLRCHLILRNDLNARGDASSGEANHFLDQLAGASIDVYEPDVYQRSLTDLVAKAESFALSQGHVPYSIPVGGSNGLGVWAYVAAMQELNAQCQLEGFSPDMIVCASGSGGTQAGLSLGAVLLAMPTQVLGFAVCDSQDYFIKKITQDIQACCTVSGVSATDAETLLHSLNLQVNDKYIGPGYAISNDATYSTIKLLATTEGVLLDPVYTGKAMHGLLSELRRGALSYVKNIVFIHTGGGFGLFPHAQAMCVE